MTGRTGPADHQYAVSVEWTGNTGSGTASYRGYDRSQVARGDGKNDILGSSDPAFLGDPARWNPEELLVVSASQCHLLWYLHLAATARVVVTSYVDAAAGTLRMNSDGGGQFSEILLRPRVVVVEPSMVERAVRLHDDVDAMCFIARSLNFPIRCEPTVTAAQPVGTQ